MSNVASEENLFLGAGGEESLLGAMEHLRQGQSVKERNWSGADHLPVLLTGLGAGLGLES